MTLPTLLILGGEGQVARALVDPALSAGWAPVRIGRAQLDLATAEIAPLLARLRPELVVNAAAFTAVDLAESEEAAAFALNADLPGRAAQACAAGDVAFVHISTDYVFDGSKPTPYVEDDPLAPLGVYGRSKAEGEARVAQAGGRAAVVRTAWVYAATGANFVRTMLRLAESRDEVSVVADQHGCPTRAGDVAEACLRIGARLREDDLRARGPVHAAGAGEASWADLAQAVFEASSRFGGPTARVRPITTAEYPTPAPRPANSRLDCRRLEALTGWRPGPWREGVEAVVAELLG